MGSVVEAGVEVEGPGTNLNLRIHHQPQPRIRKPDIHRVAVAVSRAERCGLIEPAAAPVDFYITRFWPGRVGLCRIRIRTVPVAAPFPDVAHHIVELEGSGFLAPHRVAAPF